VPRGGQHRHLLTYLSDAAFCNLKPTQQLPEWSAEAEVHVTERGKWLVGAAVVAGAAIWFASCQEQAKRQARDIAPQLSALKDSCENRVGPLKRAGIDGSGEYEKAQVAANSCIAYLNASLASGSCEEDKLKGHLAGAQRAAGEFVAWADAKLRPGETGASVPDLVAAVAGAVLDYWLKRDQAERDRLIKELEKYRFRSWEEIPAGTGAVK
jgi:hypothetical protein